MPKEPMVPAPFRAPPERMAAFKEAAAAAGLDWSAWARSACESFLRSGSEGWPLPDDPDSQESLEAIRAYWRETHGLRIENSQAVEWAVNWAARRIADPTDDPGDAPPPRKN